MEDQFSILKQLFVSTEEFKEIKKILADIQLRLPSPEPKKSLVGIEEASQIVSLSKSHIYKLRMRNNGIPCHKRPGSKKLCFDPDELLRWQKEKKPR
jgi:predicted DNA-binding transcriptional regulator AlpA